MNPRVLLLVGCVAALAFVSYLLFAASGTPTPGPIGPVAGDPSAARPAGDPTAESSRDPARRDPASGAAADTPRPPQSGAVTELETARLSVRGTVVDRAGTPVAGATVRILTRPEARAIFAAGRPRDLRSLFQPRTFGRPTTTDRDGRFMLADASFSSGTLEVGCSHPDFAPAVATRSWDVTETGTVIDLEPLTLRDGVRVSGRVLDAAGRPVADAAVTLDTALLDATARRGPRDFEDGLLDELVGEQRSDAGGNFVVEHAPPGRIRVRATARGHLDAASDPREAEDGARLDVGAIQLGPGAVLTGTVVDPRGQPIQGAELTATLSREAARTATDGGGAAADFARRRRQTASDAAGRFEFASLPARGVRIEVRHPRFVTTEREPIDPAATPDIRIELEDRLSVSGQVVDTDGEPVETFAIAARPVRTAGAEPSLSVDAGRVAARPEGGDPASAEEREARIAAARAERQRQDAYLQARLGGVGMLPGPTPEPTAHPQGRFEITDLEPGTYVFDIDAPGHVKVTHGHVELNETGPVAGLVFTVERGVRGRGRIVDATTGTAIPDARVTLRLPPLRDDDRRGDVRGAFGSGRIRGMGLESVRADADGVFELPPQRPGTYQLSIEADGYPDHEVTAFPLVPDAGLQVFEIDPGATVHGFVLGLDDDDRVRLVFIHGETGDRRAVPVDAANRSYRIAGLRPGGWFVDVEKSGQGAGDSFRRRIGQAIASRTGEPDLFVPVGGEVRHDVGAADVDLGDIRGQVLRNGEPGSGLTVRLDPASGADTAEGARMLRRLARMFSARVGDDGRFRLESVVPGNYELLVTGGDPRAQFGRSRAPVLHREPVSIRKGQMLELDIAVRAGSRAVEVVDPAGSRLPGRTLLVLVRADEAGDRAADTWDTLASRSTVDVNAGRGRLTDFPIGAWRYHAEHADFSPAEGRFEIGPIRSEPLRIRLEPR